MAEEFVIETYKILNLTDPTEYLALSDLNKSLYGLLISATKVDLSEGALARTVLWGIFPEGSTTGDNFRSTDSGIIPVPGIPIE